MTGKKTPTLPMRLVIAALDRLMPLIRHRLRMGHVATSAGLVIRKAG